MVDKKIKISALAALAIILIFLGYEYRYFLLPHSSEKSGKEYIQNLEITRNTTWDDLTNKGYSLFKDRKYYEAIEVNKIALDMAERDDNNRQIAQSLVILSILYDQVGNDDRAQELRERKSNIMTSTPLGVATEMFFDTRSKTPPLNYIITLHAVLGVLIFFLVYILILSAMWIISLTRKHRKR